MPIPKEKVQIALWRARGDSAIAADEESDLVAAACNLLETTEVPFAAKVQIYRELTTVLQGPALVEAMRQFVRLVGDEDDPRIREAFYE